MNLKFFTLILVAHVFLLTSCEKDGCTVDCLGTNGGVIVNQECECDCSTSDQVFIRGPVWSHCHPPSLNKIFALRLEEYGILDCEVIEIMYLDVSYEFNPFIGFLTPPYSSDDFKEEAIRFYITISTGGRTHPEVVSCFAVTQNEGDRSELVIYTFPGSFNSEVNSEEEARPVYLKHCEEDLLPARVIGYFDEELISLHFFFYADEDAYFNSPDQYLYSEVLNFDRLYSKKDLDE